MSSSLSPRWRKALASVLARDRLPASLIVPRLYLSDVFTAQDHDELLALGITHVITVLNYSPIIPDTIPDAHRLHIWIRDSEDENILTHLPKTTEFIIAVLAANEENKILVHCWQGISRSAIVVGAYLVASSNMRTSEALKHIRAKREIIDPNHGFRMQLEAYADSLDKGSKSNLQLAKLLIA